MCRDTYEVETMLVTKEQSHWDAWNLDRVKEGLNPERRSLCETTLEEFQSLNIPTGSRLLDIACGAGWTSERLFNHYDYLGIDIAPASITAAQAKATGAKFEVADYLDWRQSPNYYDAIICMDAIAVMREQDKAVANMHRDLKPGGWLVMTTVNPIDYSRMSWVGPPAEGQARNWLSRRALRDLLERNGFKVARLRTIVPGGDTGLLRVINARKVNSLMSLFLTAQGWRGLKEISGLGQFQIVLARK